MLFYEMQWILLSLDDKDDASGIFVFVIHSNLFLSLSLFLSLYPSPTSPHPSLACSVHLSFSPLFLYDIITPSSHIMSIRPPFLPLRPCFQDVAMAGVWSAGPSLDMEDTAAFRGHCICWPAAGCHL